MLSGLSSFCPEAHLTMFDNFEFLIRILLSGCMGCLIGFERSKRSKEAGVRTHCIVALTSAVFMIVSKYAFVDLEGVPGQRGADSARIAAQVVSGISFLGAGIIFKQGRSTVRGLTTAAGIWATSAAGLAIGAGLYWLGSIETLMILSLQFLLHKHPLGKHNMGEQTLVFRTVERREVLDDFEDLLKEHKCSIEESSIKRVGDTIEYKLDVRSDHPIEHEHALRFMEDHKEVEKFSIQTP